MLDDLVEKAYSEIDRYKEVVNKDPYRLSFHLMPPVGLLNDPNGLVKFRERYHVFYQWNPFETKHGAKYWGHYSSSDLIHWDSEPIALAPTEWYEKDGCYSGSGITYQDQLYLFYTGNVKHRDGGRDSYQCLAHSYDGIHFTKKGPILTKPGNYTAHFRDPKVWRRDDTWYMIIGAQTLTEKGAAVLFKSNDCMHWTEIGPIAGADMNGLGEFGYMWECPDLFHLDGRDVLLFCPQGLEAREDAYQNRFQSGYFVGDFDYETYVFQHGAFMELDYGFDFYAPQTFIDEKGRRILIGWMGMSDEDEAYQPTISHQWLHALTMPRELQLINEVLYQVPIPEMQLLRKNKVEVNIFVNGEFTVPDVYARVLEVQIQNITMFEKVFTLLIHHEFSLTYNSEKQKMMIERSNHRNNRRERRTCTIKNLEDIQLYIDYSSVEVFINGGEFVFTSRYFPRSFEETLCFKGNASFEFKKWDLLLKES